ncbi:ABC transporter ATP-binding protein [Methylomonas sp. MgM2]
MPIIEVSHLTKEYQLGNLTSLRETALNAFRRLTFRPTHERERFKALNDISFSIEQGEVVGVIGHNGAGKSTLLKHLASISKPTKGKVSVKGSVAPLIEVGAGVNPELTGRENIFLNAAILGIPKKVVRQKLDEIIEFSELGQFIDTPVKRYSSGMTVKLGFSIATSMEADILIVDEVLAVGDLAFQRKCFDRMEELIRRQGRTVLLVSHNIRQVERMCSRVILLSHGSILQDGDSHSTCDRFYQISNQTIHDQKIKNKSARIISSGEIQDIRVDILDIDQKVTESITEGDALRIKISFDLNAPIENPEFHIGTHTTDFVYLTGESSSVLGLTQSYNKGKHEIRHVIPSYPLVPGTYGIRFAVIDRRGRVIFHGENLKYFNVCAKSNNAPLQDELRLISVPVQWQL